MKTTIDISDALLEQARSIASRDGVTVKSLVEQGLRTVLDQRKRPVRFKLRKASVKGRGLSDEWEGASWDRLRDTAYGDTSPASSD